MNSFLIEFVEKCQFEMSAPGFIQPICSSLIKLYLGRLGFI